MPPPRPHPSWLRAAVSAASGLALAAAFPPIDLWWLMPVGLAGLMWAVTGTSGRHGLLLGFLFGLGFMLPLLRWITVIGPDAWIALSVLEAIFYGLMGASWSWLRAHRWWPAAYAVTWVGAEFLRSNVPFGGLPWGRLAFGLVETPMVSYGRLGGTALVAFLVVLVTALVYNLVSDVVVRRDRSRRSLLSAGAILTVVLLSVVLPTGPAHADRHVRIAVVQGNVPGVGMNAFAERRAVLDNHANATEALAQSVDAGQVAKPDVVIWPENSTDIDPFTDPSAYAEIEAAVRAIGVPTLVGAVVDGPDEDHVQNMGIVWSPTTGPGQRYVKRHPVPFGEYIPFRGFLTSYIDRLSQIPRDFASGDRPGVLQLGDVPIGDVICFEVAYDGLVRDVVDGGGEVLVVQTNNATYAGTGQLEQQFAISRYRAVETGRTVVVSATNGISGIVAPDGTVRAITEPETRDVLVQNVTLTSGVTPGVRFGFWLELLLAAMALGLTAYGYVGARRRGKMMR